MSSPPNSPRSTRSTQKRKRSSEDDNPNHPPTPSINANRPPSRASATPSKVVAKTPRRSSRRGSQSQEDRMDSSPARPSEASGEHQPLPTSLQSSVAQLDMSLQSPAPSRALSTPVQNAWFVIRIQQNWNVKQYHRLYVSFGAPNDRKEVYLELLNFSQELVNDDERFTEALRTLYAGNPPNMTKYIQEEGGYSFEPHFAHIKRDLKGQLQVVHQFQFKILKFDVCHQFAAPILEDLGEYAPKDLFLYYGSPEFSVVNASDFTNCRLILYCLARLPDPRRSVPPLSEPSEQRRYDSSSSSDISDTSDKLCNMFSLLNIEDSELSITIDTISLIDHLTLSKEVVGQIARNVTIVIRKELEKKTKKNVKIPEKFSMLRRFTPFP